MRKLTSVRQIGELNPIPGADAIEVATIDGWKLVVKRGEFKVGDYCVYFEIDSFLPKENPVFAFLMTRGVRTFEGGEGHKLKTIKLRGQLSQGLALPLSSFPVLQVLFKGERKLEIEELQTQFGLTAAQAEDWRNIYYGMHEYEAELAVQDFDYSNLLGVRKWEATLPAQLVGQARGLFPSFIPKTDQERCQNLKTHIFGFDDTTTPFDVANIPQEAIDTMLQKGDLQLINGIYHRVHQAKASPFDIYEVSLKLDGSSFTAYVKEDDEGNPTTGVCSRNLELKVNEENADNSFVKMFIDSGLQKAMLEVYANTKLMNGRNFAFAVQGELMGPGIQGNREGFTHNKLFIFNVYDINQGFQLPPMLAQDVVKELKKLGVTADVDYVPVIDTAVKLDELGLRSVEDLLSFAEGPSLVNPVREGLVFKRMDGQFSFKAISNKYLLGEKD
jgi:hypothetical protein